MLSDKAYKDLKEEYKLIFSENFKQQFLNITENKSCICEKLDNNLHNICSSDLIPNKECGEIEEYEFYNYPPDKYFVYVNEEKKIVTTWTGLKLGDIIFPNVFYIHEYKTNFGDTRINIKIKGINGLEYNGIYFKSSGDYARIRIAKKDKDKVKEID